MKTHGLCTSIAALLLLGWLVAGCRQGTRKAAENDITFDSIRVDESYHLLGKPENPNCTLQITFTYPTKMADKEVLRRLQQRFVADYFGEKYETLTPEEAVKRYTADYLANYKELEQDFRQELERADDTPVGAWFSYYEMSRDEIVFNRSGLLSYTVNFENYTGGAHGAHSFTNHVVELKTGNAVTEEQIFVDDYQDRLAKLLVDKLAEQNNVQDPKELENLGFFSIEEIFPNGNFLVDETGITYYFNEYEVAAYVVGVVKVHLSFDEIRLLLREESPIASLIH